MSDTWAKLRLQLEKIWDNFAPRVRIFHKKSNQQTAGYTETMCFEIYKSIYGHVLEIFTDGSACV